MCTGDGGTSSETEKAERLLAREFKNELGITIDEQALRMFVRSRWSRLSALAHRIHNAPPSAAEEAETKLKKAAHNIAGLSEEGIMNVVTGKGFATPELRKDFRLIVENIKTA